MTNGTTQAELLLFQTIGPMSIILRNITLPGLLYIFPNILQIGIWLTFVLDLLLIVLPIVLTLTLFSDHLPTLIFGQTIILAMISVVLLICDHCLINRRKGTYIDFFQQINDDHFSPTKFVTYIRLYALLATGCAILAVDFNVFPRRFAKTSIFGRSVMDLGTATFVYCFSVVDVFRNYPGRIKNITYKHWHWSLKPSSSVVLIMLGIARTILLHFTNYKYQINEYGIHWNFFITLGLLRFVVDSSGRRYHLLFGIVIALIYQYFLTKQNLQEYLISNETKRETFVSKNREGIFSFFGYLSIYYLGSAIANFLYTGISHQDYTHPSINLNRAEKRKRINVWFIRSFQLLLITAIIFIAQEFTIQLVGPPSRRIANMPYILEMVVFHNIYLYGYLFIQLLQGWMLQTMEFRNSLNDAEKNGRQELHSKTEIALVDGVNPLKVLKPFLVNSINQQGLLFFLLSNILTGLVNVSINTSSVTNHYLATAIITIYMCTCATVVHLLTRFQKKTNCQNSLSDTKFSHSRNFHACPSISLV